MEEEEKEEEEEDEEDHSIPELCKEGGCPVGSTIKYSQSQELAQKQAIIFVAVKYAIRHKHRENKGKHRLESSVREKLVKREIEMFNIAGKFIVPKQTILNCIKADQLEFWHSGTQSPVLE